jgi:hypothetical protein
MSFDVSQAPQSLRAALAPHGGAPAKAPPRTKGCALTSHCSARTGVAAGGRGDGALAADICASRAWSPAGCLLPLRRGANSARRIPRQARVRVAATGRRDCDAIALRIPPAGEDHPPLRPARESRNHGNDGYAGFVIKRLRRHAHPVAQPVTGCVGERDARRVHAGARRLAANGKSGSRTCAQHRPRLMGQWFGEVGFDTVTARANGLKEAIKLGCGHSPSVMPSLATTYRARSTLSSFASIASLICVSTTCLASKRS